MTNNPNPSLMGEERAREVLAGKLEAGGFLVSARKVRTPGELPAAWLWAPIVEAMLAIAEEARAAERERCAAIAEIAPDGSDGNMHGPMEAYRHARREIATAIRKLLV